VLVKIFWLACGPEAAKTELDPVKFTAADPEALPLKVIVAISWLPVTAGKAPRSIFTVPLPPEVAASIENAGEEVTLTKVSTLAL
jgi:hypothetical protein